MNAISGPATSRAVAALWTNAPVGAVRAIAGNDQRVPLSQRADRFEPSSSNPAMPQVVYGRDGRGGGRAPDGDGDGC